MGTNVREELRRSADLREYGRKLLSAVRIIIFLEKVPIKIVEHPRDFPGVGISAEFLRKRAHRRPCCNEVGFNLRRVFIEESAGTRKKVAVGCVLREEGGHR